MEALTNINWDAVFCSDFYYSPGYICYMPLLKKALKITENNNFGQQEAQKLSAQVSIAVFSAIWCSVTALMF